MHIHRFLGRIDLVLYHVLLSGMNHESFRGFISAIRTTIVAATIFLAHRFILLFV